MLQKQPFSGKNWEILCDKTWNTTPFHFHKRKKRHWTDTTNDCVYHTNDYKAAKNQRWVSERAHFRPFLSLLSNLGWNRWKTLMRGALDEKGVCLIWLHAASLMHCLSLQQSCSRGVSIYYCCVHLPDSAKYPCKRKFCTLWLAIPSRRVQIYIGARIVIAASLSRGGAATPERTQ